MAGKEIPGAKPELPAAEKGRSVTTVEAPVAARSDSMGAPETGFPIVGIGASAGGLAAIEAFFSAMPPDTESGMAFVVVQHLDPDHKSMLLDLVKQYTRMQVFKVEEGMEVEPNCAYIIPPNRDMAFRNGKLHLLEPSAPRGLRLPIDFFFRSLAQDQHERGICIVLSGTGTDGTLGLKAIKGEGGMAMVQDPQSASYDGMPRSAIATGMVDYVLSPGTMPEQLIAYVQHAFGLRPKPIVATAPLADDSLQKVFILLRTQTGHDFSQYKQNTILRRMERRMAVAQIDRFEDYVHYLQETPLEVETLFRELLIGVTNFFRDPQAFESVREHVFPRLFAGRTPERSVRVWVPGCSTGEEAYSLAILTREYLDELKQPFRVQVFATDIDAAAIEKARAGVYPDSIAADVSPERLSRFFTQENNAYRINKTIRDLVLFAKQDVLKDPYFSRIDLISCRNLLIYLGVEAQKRIQGLFHHALNQDGYLLLGNSETIGEFTDLFAVVDKKWRIYQHKNVVTPRSAMAPYVSLPVPQAAAWRGRKGPEGLPTHGGGARGLTQRLLLEAYSPASVLINAELDVLYIHGSTGKWLEPAAGEASLNLMRMAREGLRMELTAAVRKAVSQQKKVRYEGLRVKSNGDTSVLDLTVLPVMKPEGARGLVLVIFEEAVPTTGPAAEAAEAPISDPESHRLVTLEQELRAKEEYLQTTVEELRSTNEELQSANEELQSTNEELETSQEELQSVNEELVTVNTELQKKIEELSRANNDMNNLLAGTNIGTLFLDHQLRIQRYTPSMTRTINLIRTDVGRPVSDIAFRLGNYDRLVQDTREVLDTLTPKETQVLSQEGQWYQLRIQPYRTLENVIEGAVLTFVEITEQKRLQMALIESEEKLRTLFEMLPVGVAVLDAQGKIAYVNPALEKMLEVSHAGLMGGDFTQFVYLKADGTSMPAKETAGMRALKEQQAVYHVETGVGREDGRVVWTDMSAVPVALSGWRVIVVFFDLHGRRGPGETSPEPDDAS